LSNYLAAYTAAFDGTGTQMRFVSPLRDEREFGHYFLDTVPLQEQGCMLVNVTPPDFMRWMQEHGIHYVVQFFTDYPCEHLPKHHSVIVNKFRGAFEMVRHLLDLGHRRIGFMGPLDLNDLNGAVYRGYRAGMEWAGIRPENEDLVNLATDDPEVTVGPAMKYLNRKERPTALFLQTDAMAQGVLTAARRLGLRVPEDMSVAGFDDSPGADATKPPLTTVTSPRYQLARAAADMLLTIAKGGFQSWQRQVLECRVVVRKSTAAPGGASAKRSEGADKEISGTPMGERATR
jgi:DNA-binding LacI/PurR family transcriptional regulator